MAQVERTTLEGVTLTGARGVETLTPGDVQESFEKELVLVLIRVTVSLGVGAEMYRN